MKLKDPKSILIWLAVYFGITALLVIAVSDLTLRKVDALKAIQKLNLVVKPQTKTKGF